MKERPIIFNAEMVNAILSGRKTQTRRVLSPRQLMMIDAASSIGECYPLESGHQHTNSQSYYREFCPFGAVGDKLWVRETWSSHSCFDDYKPSELGPLLSFHYWADGHLETGKKRPSLHMPRWASRITLEITGVRVERLNSISEEDAAAEGVQLAGDLLPNYPGTYLTPKGDFATAKVAFQRLWESIYGAESWQANPWCWVIEFKRLRF